MSDRAAVVCRGLTRRFGEVTALDGLDLAVQPGVIFGFLGPNGAGKTTTIRLLAGLDSPTAGTGEVLGYDIERAGNEVRRRIAYLDQLSLLSDIVSR
ncbi:MAG: ATP-binding cassette domain-containing protein [SAR202 cluster bacterium]|nr:ATP-binding cassette domain-containing protein [SAR202 cluster bacterium]